MGQEWPNEPGSLCLSGSLSFNLSKSRSDADMFINKNVMSAWPSGIQWIYIENRCNSLITLDPTPI